MTEDKREGNVIIGGDFNLRIGEEGGVKKINEADRKSKDKTIGNGSRKLVRLINEIGGNILNGSALGDRKGEYTYVEAKGCSVIDYVIVNQVCNSRVLEFKIGNQLDSDHLLTTLILKGEDAKEDEEEEGQETLNGEKTVYR